MPKIIGYFIFQEAAVKRTLLAGESSYRLRFVRETKAYGKPEDVRALQALYQNLLLQVNALELVLEQELIVLESRLSWSLSVDNPLTRRDALRYEELVHADLRELAVEQVWREWRATVADIPATDSPPFAARAPAGRWEKFVDELKLVFS